MDNLQILFAAPIFTLQLLIDGILIGSIFALAAFGMAMVWGVMKIINFAQGKFVILGGFVLFSLTRIGLNPFLAIPLVAVVLFIVGWALYHIVIVRIVEKDLFISILATFGIAIPAAAAYESGVRRRCTNRRPGDLTPGFCSTTP